MKQILELLIKEWWNRPLPKTIARDINLEEFANLNLRKAISVIGFRRVGKTYLLFDLAKKIGQQNCIYLNLEDERIPRSTQLLTELLEVLVELKGPTPYTFLLDEIQNIPSWSLWVRRVLENTQHKLFISGSSSKLSSSQLPTELRGRSLSIKVSPLNFSEFLRFKNKDISLLPKAEILNLVREYIIYGGFPEVVLVEEGKKPLIIDEYYQTFLLRDLIERYNIRNDLVLKNLLKLLLNSSYYAISKLANTLKSSDNRASKSTVSRYLNFLEESLFLRSLTIHTPSIKNRLKAPKKPFFVDSFFLSRMSTQFSCNLGKIMEQVVASEIFKKLEADPFLSVFYWKDYANHEIDFVIRKRETTEELVQVCFAASQGELPERETKSLIKAAKVLDCQNLTIITWDLEKELKIDRDKIKCLPLWVYLK